MMKAICLILGLIILFCAMVVEAKDFKFPEITGWKQSGEVQTYTPKTLYEYINGAADLYLMYDFQELKVAEYQNDKKASITVEVYRHQTPTHAFGIYSQEHLPSANFIEIGTQGYIENNVFNFLTGPYYVKISSYNTGAEDQGVLFAFAKTVSENLGEKGTPPSILTTFPAEGKIKNSEKFIAQNFLGYSFFYSAFTADYELSDKKFKLFIIEGTDNNECKTMIEKYLQSIKSPRKEVTEGRYIFSDPYHGEIELHWKGRYLWGILNINDQSLRSKYLKLFEEGLQKRN
jgi:hypothetical protein